MRLAKIFMSAATAFLLMTASHSTASAAADHKGVVLEAITGGGYTYMNIEENGKKFWIASPETSVKKGAEVSFSEQLWMPNFTSKALHRTFDRILFVSGVDGGTAVAAASNDEEELSDDELMDDEEYAPEPPPADGIYTIERIYYEADELKGKRIKVRGKVVKVSENIMGMTWVHIQDGTGTRGKNKLIFRSLKGTASVGETVVAEGRLDTDKDFGFGYYYAVIVDDAKFTEEPVVKKAPEKAAKPVVKKAPEKAAKPVVK